MEASVEQARISHILSRARLVRGHLAAALLADEQAALRHVDAAEFALDAIINDLLAARDSRPASQLSV